MSEVRYTVVLCPAVSELIHVTVLLLLDSLSDRQSSSLCLSVCVCVLLTRSRLIVLVNCARADCIVRRCWRSYLYGA